MSNNKNIWDPFDEDDYVFDGFDLDIEFFENMIDKKEKKCDHEWVSQIFFSPRVYETCKKCGAKKEEI